jgi:hypothetical protein
MKNVRLLILTFMAVSVTACGQFSSSKSAGSSSGLSLNRKPFGTCDRKDVVTTNLCMEATGSDYNEVGYLSILESSCESSGGVFSTSNCDQTGSFGVCIVAPGQPNETYITYYPPQYSADSAKSACESAGNSAVWVAY